MAEKFEGRLQDVPMKGDNEPVIGETLFVGQPQAKRRFDVILPTADTTGDFDEMEWLAGPDAGQVKVIRPVAQIVEEMMAGAGARLHRSVRSVARGVLIANCPLNWMRVRPSEGDLKDGEIAARQRADFVVFRQQLSGVMIADVGPAKGLLQGRKIRTQRIAIRPSAT